MNLHQESWRDFLLSYVNLNRVRSKVYHTGRVLLAWLPDIVKPRQDVIIDFKNNSPLILRFAGLFLLDCVVSECQDLLKHFIGRLLCVIVIILTLGSERNNNLVTNLGSEGPERLDDVLNDLVEGSESLT